MIHPFEISLRTTLTNTMIHYILSTPRHMSTQIHYIRHYVYVLFFKKGGGVGEVAKTMKRTGWTPGCVGRIYCLKSANFNIEP